MFRHELNGIYWDGQSSCVPVTPRPYNVPSWQIQYVGTPPTNVVISYKVFEKTPIARDFVKEERRVWDDKGSVDLRHGFLYTYVLKIPLYFVIV